MTEEVISYYKLINKENINILTAQLWIPASAGMTEKRGQNKKKSIKTVTFSLFLRINK
jgi:hypothetical protein